MKTAIISLIVFYVVLELIVKRAEYQSEQERRRVEELRQKLLKEREEWSKQYRR